MVFFPNMYEREVQTTAGFSLSHKCDWKRQGKGNGNKALGCVWFLIIIHELNARFVSIKLISGKNWICWVGWTESSYFPLSRWRTWIGPVSLSLCPDEDMKTNTIKNKTTKAKKKLELQLISEHLQCVRLFTYPIFWKTEADVLFMVKFSTAVTLKQQQPQCFTSRLPSVGFFLERLFS